MRTDFLRRLPRWNPTEVIPKTMSLMVRPFHRFSPERRGRSFGISSSGLLRVCLKTTEGLHGTEGTLHHNRREFCRIFSAPWRARPRTRCRGLPSRRRRARRTSRQRLAHGERPSIPGKRRLPLVTADWPCLGGPDSPFSAGRSAGEMAISGGNPPASL